MKSRKSERQVILYLDKFEISKNEKNKILLKLKNINLINDLEFTKAYINDKLILSKCGINKIKEDLINNNISIDIINSCIDDIDMSKFNDRLESLIIKKIKANKKYSNKELKQKLLIYFINLGYDRENILEIIDNNLGEDKTILEAEFYKQYNLLSLKYKDNELKNKLKQKLISKGFNYDEICSFIEKI